MKFFKTVMQVSVLILCGYLIYLISGAVFRGEVYFNSARLMSIQLWICTWFITVFIIDFFLSGKRKWKYLRDNFIFLIISIPYLNIIDFMGWNTSFTVQEIGMLRFIPLIRGGYALAYLVKWLSINKISSIFFSYIIILLSCIYFGSLIFYEIEQGINIMVLSYWDAAWWALMDATTVGSNIYAVTPIGKILSVLLAALGMMMFPIFTIYITTLIQNKKKKPAQKHFF
ncbi:MAG: ion channel [Bacteroidales bacterium]